MYTASVGCFVFLKIRPLEKKLNVFRHVAMVHCKISVLKLTIPKRVCHDRPLVRLQNLRAQGCGLEKYWPKVKKSILTPEFLQCWFSFSPNVSWRWVPYVVSRKWGAIKYSSLSIKGPVYFSEQLLIICKKILLYY